MRVLLLTISLFASQASAGDDSSVMSRRRFLIASGAAIVATQLPCEKLLTSPVPLQRMAITAEMRATLAVYPGAYGPGLEQWYYGQRAALGVIQETAQFISSGKNRGVIDFQIPPSGETEVQAREIRFSSSFASYLASLKPDEALIVSLQLPRADGDEAVAGLSERHPLARITSQYSESLGLAVITLEVPRESYESLIQSLYEPALPLPNAIEIRPPPTFLITGP